MRAGFDPGSSNFSAKDDDGRRRRRRSFGHLRRLDDVRQTTEANIIGSEKLMLELIKFLGVWKTLQVVIFTSMSVQWLSNNVEKILIMNDLKQLLMRFMN